jgi:hypothetical protein
LNHYQESEPSKAGLIEIADPEETNHVGKERCAKDPEHPFFAGIANDRFSGSSNP